MFDLDNMPLHILVVPFYICILTMYEYCNNMLYSNFVTIFTVHIYIKILSFCI